MNSKPKKKEIFTSLSPSASDTFRGRGEMIKKKYPAKKPELKKLLNCRCLTQ